MAGERCAERVRPGLDDGGGRGRLAAHDGGNLGLEYAGLLTRDFRDRRAEVLGVVDAHGRDGAEGRGLENVGGVEPATQARLQQEDIRRLAREGQEGGGGGDLEEGDGGLAVGHLAFFQEGGQLGLWDQLAGQADAFVKAHQVR